MTSSRPLAAGLVALLICAACGTPLEKKLSVAEAALEAARRAEAPLYAPEAYARATQALETARAEVQKQARTSWLSKDDDVALALVASAKAAGREAVTQAIWNRDDARLETEVLINGARKEIASARHAFDGSAATEPPTDALEQDLERAEGRLFEAQRAFDQGDYRDARRIAEKAKDVADSAVSRVSLPASMRE